MRQLAFLMLIMLCWGCKKDQKQDLLMFSDLSSEETGIDFRNDLSDQEFNLMDYMYFYNGGGVSVGDVNNDGKKDLFFTANQGKNRLFLNQGDFRFEDVTEQSGIAHEEGSWTTGTTMADINGDGFLDIYVCELGNYKDFNGRNKLYINKGDGTFEEKAEAYGLGFSGYATQSLFFDYDNDGDLDVYLLNHAVHTDHAYRDARTRMRKDSLAGDRLLRQDFEDGEIMFRDVTEESGIYSSVIGYGLGVSAGDLNQDGYTDLYISNDFHENDYMYLNQGDGTFREVLESSMGHSSRYSMGNDMADINNDLLPDIMTLDMLPRDEAILKKSVGEDSYEVYEIKLQKGYHHQLVRNTLQVNLGNSRYSDIALLTGVYATDWSWAPLICDLDNDGFKDIYISNGIYKRPNDLDYVNYHSNNSQKLYQNYSQDSVDQYLMELMPTLKIPNYVFSGGKDFHFKDKTDDWGLNKPSYSNGMVYSDLDNDGDLDLVVNNVNDLATVYRNNSDSLTNHHYLKVRLSGSERNRFGIGAKVILYTTEGPKFQENIPTRGFMSSVDPELNFGLGKSNIDSLTVIWPGGKFQTLRSPISDQTLTLNIKDAKGSFEMKSDLENPYLKNEGDLPDYLHTENDFVDFNREYLMPHMISREGPFIADGDINGDGLDDMLIGGAAGQPISVLLQLPEGGFEYATQQIFEDDKLAEDVGMVLFDADSDGDQDLYVASGGNEFEPGSAVLQDRLYLNEGGEFTKAELPSLKFNSSCVVPYDMDADGDLDLFVGARSIAGSYGAFPSSKILSNNGDGSFEIVEVELLDEMGMVTAAQWGDFNKDSFADIAIVGEWMPLTILYGSAEGSFSSYSLGYTEGWWNTLVSMDLDNDGDLDLVGGNLGLNSKIKATQSEPASLYVKDFDKDGQMDQVLCFYKEGKSVPFASRDELIKQMVSLKKKFPSYLDFSKVESIEDLLSAKSLEGAEVKKAYLFETVVFQNEGDGNFSVKKLPVEVQFAPVNAILTEDFNKDGKADLFMSGNFNGAIINRGKYDAGYGWLLMNKGDEFSILESDLKVAGDVRDMKKVKAGSSELIIISKNNQQAQVLSIK